MEIGQNCAWEVQMLLFIWEQLAWLSLLQVAAFRMSAVVTPALDAANM